MKTEILVSDFLNNLDYLNIDEIVLYDIEEGIWYDDDIKKSNIELIETFIKDFGYREVINFSFYIEDNIKYLDISFK